MTDQIHLNLFEETESFFESVQQSLYAYRAAIAVAVRAAKDREDAAETRIVELEKALKIAESRVVELEEIIGI